MKQDSKLVKHNIRVHDVVCDKYEQLHPEIFNSIEQARLHEQLKKAISLIQNSSAPKTALDYGCGTGNLTKHLLDLGLQVTAADITDNFLRLVQEKHKDVKTLKINGQDLSGVEDESFDFVATYSVLHHVPDYLKIIKEMARVTKLGGIVYLDHEVNELFWNRTKEYEEFLNLVGPLEKKTWRKFLKRETYVDKFHRILNSRYQKEGDIHIWPDDHIEWDKIEQLLVGQGFEIAQKNDYLVYRQG